MKVEYWMCGRISQRNYQNLIDEYLKRTQIFLPLHMDSIIAPKSRKSSSIIDYESEKILGKLKTDDFLVLLDSKGKSYSSQGFAIYLSEQFNRIGTRLIFVSGGAYGFSEELYKRKQDMLSLSRMTFTHDMSAVIFLEQFYRAMCIISGHPYQH
jgi:23S rRNA (pseudouridine1915-N3)-methyltransferase